MTLSKIIPKTGVKVAFIDNDGKKVDGITVNQANQISKNNPNTKFYFQNGDGLEQELSIDQVNQLTTANLLPTAPACPTGPQVCGPPLVRFFGGGGVGAIANTIISPISSSIIAFDIVDSGFGFFDSPSAELIDPCGKGSGAKLQVNMEDDDEDTANLEGQITTGGAAGGTGAGPSGVPTTETQCEAPRKLFEESILKGLRRSKKIKNITIIAPGDGYLATPDGSLGGNEGVWKEPDEGFVKTKCGGYYVVQPYRPIKVEAGDTYYPPDGPPRTLTEPEVITLPLVPITPPPPENIGATYPVVLIIDEIKVLDPGFGYRPGDQLIINPSNGAVADLVINERGEIDRVNLIQSGVGFLDLPNLSTNSSTGFNATFSTILKPIRVDINKPVEEQIKQFISDKVISNKPLNIESKNIPQQIEIISVIDCVGKIPPSRTFIAPR
jgi:hypothetical protein